MGRDSKHTARRSSRRLVDVSGTVGVAGIAVAQLLGHDAVVLRFSAGAPRPTGET